MNPQMMRQWLAGQAKKAQITPAQIQRKRLGLNEGPMVQSIVQQVAMRSQLGMPATMAGNPNFRGYSFVPQQSRFEEPSLEQRGEALQQRFRQEKTLSTLNSCEECKKRNNGDITKCAYECHSQVTTEIIPRGSRVDEFERRTPFFPPRPTNGQKPQKPVLEAFGDTMFSSRGLPSRETLMNQIHPVEVEVSDPVRIDPKTGRRTGGGKRRLSQQEVEAGGWNQRRNDMQSGIMSDAAERQTEYTKAFNAQMQRYTGDVSAGGHGWQPLNSRY